MYRRFIDAENDTPPTPRIRRFVAALLERYPDLSELDDDAIEDSPWTDGPLIYNASGRFMCFNVVANEAGEEAWTYAVRTARASGLVCFDPQSGALAKVPA
jgi:hypothetical protein